MLIAFLLQDNAIFLRLELLKGKIAFNNFSYNLKHKKDIFFYFLAFETLRAKHKLDIFIYFSVYKISRAIVTLFFSIFLQLYFSNGKRIPSKLY